MHFSPWFLSHFGIDLGSFWDPFWEPKSAPDPAHHWSGAIWFSILWSDGPKMAPRPSQDGSWAVLGPSWGGLGPLLGASWGVLGRSWGLLGPIWAVLGLVLDRLGVVLEPFWGSIRWFDSSLRFNDAIRRFDSLIRSVSFVNSLSTPQLWKSWAALGDSWALLEGSWRPVDSFVYVYSSFFDVRCSFLFLVLLLWMFGVDFYDWCLLIGVHYGCGLLILFCIDIVCVRCWSYMLRLTLLVGISVSVIHLSSLFVDGTFVDDCCHCFFI